MRARTVIVGAVVLVAAAVFVVETFTKGPLAFAGGQTVALADYHEADPTGVPKNLANADQVKRGEYLARAADCMVCHTAPGGADYAGGLAIPLPFGTLYSTNITPDKDTGIGSYSDQEFLDALRRGKRRDGAHLYPAMPFTSYTYMTDADGLAIKAYLFSLPAVHATAPDNTFAFPFNQRWADGCSGRRCSTPTPASRPIPIAARNGTEAPISPKRSPIAASATRRGISPSRSTTAKSSPAR